jgi:hypothetical protein
MAKLLARVLTVVFLASIYSTSSASVFVESNFSRTGQTESLIAPLTQFGGVTTTQQWSGLVEVILSGEAVNNPPTGLHVDPFWAFFPSNPSVIQGTGTRFRLSFSGCATSFECGAPDIVLFMSFVDGVGFVDPPNVPTLDPIPVETVIPILQSIIPYSTSHTYRFVIDIGPEPKFLTLGDGDGGVFDNSGQFNIQLFSVTPGLPFSNFSSRLEVRMNPDANDDRFEISGKFVLGPGNDGVNPLSENVTIVLGNISRTIPAGSFKRNKQGVFKFEGLIDGAKLNVTIRPNRGNYEFVATGVGVDLAHNDVLLSVGLRIGNDAGSTPMAYTRLFAESD